MNKKLIELGEFIHKSLLNGSSKTNPAFDEAMLLFVCNSLTVLKEQDKLITEARNEGYNEAYRSYCVEVEEKDQETQLLLFDEL